MPNIKTIKYLCDISEKQVEALAQLVPEEFRLEFSLWIGGESLDEFWLLRFGRKYLDKYNAFTTEFIAIVLRNSYGEH